MQNKPWRDPWWQLSVICFSWALVFVVVGFVHTPDSRIGDWFAFAIWPTIELFVLFREAWKAYRAKPDP